jgi:DNA-binding HxlR family transcriptional regulator
MNNDNIPYRQSLLDALAVLNGRWIPAVLSSLATGPLSFGELQATINKVEKRSELNPGHGLTRKVLAETLARLQRDEIVHRQAASSDVPFQNVWYELTPMGRSLLKSLRPLIAWAQEHHQALAYTRTGRIAPTRSDDGS